MKRKTFQWYPILLLTFIFSNTISSQDTLLLHYANATISEVILDGSGNGFITGKGEDESIGKYMFFDSGLHKSPVTDLTSILMDLEVSNFTELDSFSVFVQQYYDDDWIDTWEKKYSFSEIEQESIPISGNEITGYNFKIDLLENEVGDIGNLKFNVGIKYDYNSNAQIALRATGEGEFQEANTRCFTINQDESVSDFVTKYEAEVGLAIFPVTELSGSIEDISAMGIEIQNSANNHLVIKSNNSTEHFNLSLLSLDGRILKQLRLNSYETIEVKTSILPTGIYILNASNAKRNNSVQLFIH